MISWLRRWWFDTLVLAVTIVILLFVLASCANRPREWTDQDFGRLAHELGKQQRETNK